MLHSLRRLAVTRGPKRGLEPLVLHALVRLLGLVLRRVPELQEPPERTTTPRCVRGSSR